MCQKFERAPFHPTVQREFLHLKVFQSLEKNVVLYVCAL